MAIYKVYSKVYSKVYISLSPGFHPMFTTVWIRRSLRETHGDRHVDRHCGSMCIDMYICGVDHSVTVEFVGGSVRRARSCVLSMQEEYLCITYAYAMDKLCICLRRNSLLYRRGSVVVCRNDSVQILRHHVPCVKNSTVFSKPALHHESQ